jgi:hypothetical protein
VTLPSLGFVTWNGRYPGTGDGQMARDLAGDAFGVLRPALNALTLRRRPIVAHQFFERCEKSSNGDVSRCRVVWRTSFRHLAFVHRPCARWKPPRRRTTAESAPRATCRDGPNPATRGSATSAWQAPGRREIAEASWSCPDALVPARQGLGFSRLRTSGREPGKVSDHSGARGPGRTRARGTTADGPRPRRGRRRARQRNRQPRKAPPAAPS